MSSARKSGVSVRRWLIVLPVGLLFLAVMFDIVYLSTNDPRFSFVAYWNMGPGILVAFLAAAFGVWDWLTFPMGTRAKTLGLGHGLANLGVGALFVTSWVLRQATLEHTPSPLAIVLAVAAAVLAAAGGWFGNELLLLRRSPTAEGVPGVRRPTPGAVIYTRPLPEAWAR